MSQNYFDTQINRIGLQAAQLAKVINPSKILQEEINSWSDILD